MKSKSLVFVLLVMLIGSSVFAAGADSYVVKSVVGNVNYETAPGKLDGVVEVNQKLSLSTVIKTNLNTKLVLVSEADGKEVTISANKKGTVETLVKDSSSVAKGSLTKKSSSKSSVAKAATGSDTTVSTASSRASDAAADFEYMEE